MREEEKICKQGKEREKSKIRYKRKEKCTIDIKNCKKIDEEISRNNTSRKITLNLQAAWPRMYVEKPQKIATWIFLIE